MSPRLWTTVLILALLALLGCKNEDDVNNDIVPIKAAVSVKTVTDDPAIFLIKSPQDTRSDDDIAVLDVMLRQTLMQEFDDVSLHVRFDPGIVQFMGFTQSPESDGQTFNPFGACNSSTTYCAKYPAPPAGNPTPPPPTEGPLCLPTGIGSANTTGDLLLGMAALPPPPASRQCDSYAQGGTLKLFTLTFVASSVGTSQIQLISTAAHDCEILNNFAAVFAPCVDSEAKIIASR